MFLEVKVCVFFELLWWDLLFVNMVKYWWWWVGLFVGIVCFGFGKLSEEVGKDFSVGIKRVDDNCG